MNRRIRTRLQIRSTALKDSDKQLRHIFDITFSDPALVMCETNDGFRVKAYTYGEVRTMVDTAASAIYDRLGATGRYVALELENSVSWVVAFWAILKSGNKPYLVNMRYPAAMSRSILQTLGITEAICETASALGVTALPFDTLKSDTAVPADVFENEFAFSSSATSMKEVVCFYTGAQVAAQIENFRSIVDESPSIADHYHGALKQLAFLPFYHIFGLFAVFFWFTFFGTTLVFLRDYAADTILKTCRRHEVTHIFAVPMLWHTVEKQVLAAVHKKGDKTVKKFEKGLKTATVLQNLCPALGRTVSKRLLREVTDQLFGRSVKFCISGGSYLRDSALTLLNGIGYHMHNGYGMSEIGITSVDLRQKPKHLNQNSIGRPFDAVEYRIDENGILLVRGGTLCTKKLVNGTAVAPSEWFSTDDAMSCENGYYYIHGRKGDMVIAESGENINPDMVEKALTLTDALAFSVLGLDSEDGEVLSLVVQVDPMLGHERREALLAAIDAFNTTLPPVMAIRRVVLTHAPLMAANAVKVSRAQLKKKIADGELPLIERGAFVDATVADGDGEINRALAERINGIIAEVLHIDAATIDDNAHLFFDLGATSMQYFAILTKLAEAFPQVTYDNNDTYRYTPKAMREFIEERL